VRELGEGEGTVGAPVMVDKRLVLFEVLVDGAVLAFADESGGGTEDGSRWGDCEAGH